jgi:hypothetical protein
MMSLEQAGLHRLISTISNTIQTVQYYIIYRGFRWLKRNVREDVTFYFEAFRRICSREKLISAIEIKDGRAYDWRKHMLAIVDKCYSRKLSKYCLQVVIAIRPSGDFNATPGDEPIRVIMDRSNPLHLVDSKEISLKPHYGPSGTFNAFKEKERDDQPIDYIFLKGNWKVIKHATISQSWQGRFASDHFSVLATVLL